MNALNTALLSRLSGGTALTALVSTRIYHLQAPENSDTPYVVWNTQSEVENNETSHRVKEEVVFVRAYAAKAITAGSVDTQIDALLHMNVLTVTGYENIWLVREQGLELVENPPSGTPVFMQGGIYRITLEKS